MDSSAKESPGLEDRYVLRRTRDGSEVEGPYFIVRYSDSFAPVALRAYANACATDHPALARDLRNDADYLDLRNA
jgi:hypothetical protein